VKKNVQGASDVDAPHEGVGEQGAQLEGPDAGAGAHVEELAGLGDRGEDVTAQEAAQGGEGGRDESRPYERGEAGR
jgi:hypothetical protein